MAPPRLYHTLEEKKAANRAKSARSYEKNKDKIQIRRQTRYKLLTAKDTPRSDQVPHRKHAAAPDGGKGERRRQKKVKHKHDKKIDQATFDKGAEQADDDVEAAEGPDLSSVTVGTDWIGRARQAAEYIARLTSFAPEEFTDNLCAAYIESIRNKTPDFGAIQGHLDNFSKLQRSVGQAENAILALEGMSVDREEASFIGRRITEMVRWLEDICIHANDPDELIALYSRDKLMYQLP